MKCDGILGLSPGDMSLQDNERRSLRGNNTNRFIENLYQQGKIQERVFSFFLSEYNNYREIPAFTIGGYDIEKFDILSKIKTWMMKLFSCYYQSLF